MIGLLISKNISSIIYNASLNIPNVMKFVIARWENLLLRHIDEDVFIKYFSNIYQCTKVLSYMIFSTDCLHIQKLPIDIILMENT